MLLESVGTKLAEGLCFSEGVSGWMLGQGWRNKIDLGGGERGMKKVL